LEIAVGERKGAVAGGNRVAKAVGETSPSSEGPNMIPATISPTTGGCLMRTNARPTSRASPMITAISSRMRISV